jgi:hypothetical protein
VHRAIVVVAGQPGPALAGPVINLTRQPIVFAKKMDARVEPAHDDDVSTINRRNYVP